jgi:hypothetical protein
MSRAADSRTESSLHSDPVQSTLRRLHAAAAGDWKKFLGITPRYLAGLVMGTNMHETITPAVARDLSLPVSPAKGEFWHHHGQSVRAIIEFGTSSVSPPSTSQRQQGQWRRTGDRFGD